MLASITKRIFAAVLCTAAIAASPAALADMTTFTIEWKPSDPNGTFLSTAVSASAILTMDTKYINQPGQGISMADVQSLSLTIGSDTFTKSNFDSISFAYPHALIYSGELIGQYTGQQAPTDFTGPFGTMVGQGGVFGLNGNGSALPGSGDIAPVSIQAFVMSTNGTPWVNNGLTHSIMRVSSIIATPATLAGSPISAVPEPGTYAMLLAGLGFSGWMARRKRAAARRA